ncbi:ATP-binding protein [Clostridium kluyveri]|uniref:ATP-binding protein n=1 Tax=Clostridium kluyveri TaxID=1534 RepID=UPI0022469842|nr:ATP-binding protein [Clostridium kluyveri]UZQ51897.1 ATP-binding protein [Clostridium kluyveri]
MSLRNENNNEFNFDKRAERYEVKEPKWDFKSLILTKNVLEELEISLSIIENETLVFDTWGLRTFEPHPRSALNFYGPPGTGKTMAAHAIANKLGKKILIASYAQIESKYHGEGPKNVEALFMAAQKNDAVLFIDEADSMLSKRLTHVTQGSEQAINSMRSQLLICLEKFKGVVIFATNLVKNYDYAFETRVKNINFTMPDEECREKIWEVHLLPSIPKSYDVNTKELAEKFTDFCGRDIKNAVIDACLFVAVNKKDELNQNDIIKACDRILEKRNNLHEAENNDLYKNSKFDYN